MTIEYLHWGDEDPPTRCPGGTTGREFPREEDWFPGQTLEGGGEKPTEEEEKGDAERDKKARDAEKGDTEKEEVKREDAGPDHEKPELQLRKRARTERVEELKMPRGVERGLVRVLAQKKSISRRGASKDPGEDLKEMRNTACETYVFPSQTSEINIS
ncbi:hypothetical protein NDU88_003273 [Pleurodeles waltl]|uniref:Uncharacterized protein n=1 Tax=Pleurodeles waltl TaxID=8319 RepID=A0AAV7SG61_PLEWA|nr:hypothetical protein NDU88_003273 [Pleurodeles waltl]